MGSAALFGISLIATPAYAQNNNTCTPEQAAQGTCTLPPAAQTAQEGTGQTVEVTGTRIRRPNLESTVPITSLNGDQIFQTGDSNVGETLNELPQLRSTFAQQNPGLGIGIAGLNLLDLRGLGTQRTLVLVNGRRHVAADILNNAVSPDIGSIPNDLIERIDIVTGGNSAIYGSDAIAGVVNFVLRRDFSGLQLRAQAATTEAGYGSAQYVSAMYGLNFNDGAGNITLHGEYSRQERVFASDIPWFRTNNGFFAVDTDANGGGNVLVNGSDGFPDAIFIRDVRSVTINPRGLVPIAQRNSPGAACGNGTLANFGGPNSNGNAFNCTYIFDNTGRLVPQTGARFGSGPTGGIIGGNGQTGREGQTVSILPFLERYNANLLFHYTFSPALEFFAEAKWARVNALGNNAGPSFIQGQNTQFDFRELPRLDNPFLNPADRTLLSNLILASGCRSTLATVCPAAGNLSPIDIANIANGSYRFTLARNLLDVGLRDEHFQRDTWRVVGGFRGTFNDDWTYEVSANYGRFDEAVTTDGFIDRQRFALAMDAGRNPITGQIQCRSQFDPASAIVLQRGVSAAQVAGNAASLAADIAACVPYNPFGAADNRASVAYFAREFTAKSSLDQLVLNGFMSGDTSGFFNLPGGPIRFAIGAEYRREKASYVQDQYVTDGFTNGVSIPSFVPPAFEVKELFGEIQLPILREQPFAYELTLSGAARVARYQGGTGTVWAYNAGVDWAPIRDIRFRGNYSRAVRAPNVSETGFPLVPNFAPGFQDPCNQTRISASALRTTQCTTAVGAGNLPNLTSIAFSLPIVSGSNPNLTAETSDSWTFGAVLQPRWIPGLSITVDYYNIKVTNIIASLGAQAIVDSCYDTPQPNVFCTAFSRWAGPGLGPNGEQPGAILGNSLIVAPLNFASRVRRGIDTQIAYRLNISSDVRLNTNLIYTHNLEINNFQDQLNPTFANRILGEVGDPVDEFRLDVDLSYRNFTFGYRMHYIGPMYIGAWENNNGINGFPPANDDAFEIRKYPAITYNDIRFEWNINNRVGFADSLRFYFGVDNIFDRHPPLGTTATGAGTAIYDIRGRSYYAGIRARF
ncbi:TonB-dependent receptor domain-containing protein [Allosphingosinicella sp.]|uniref:TonB-dependent receptor domain-containing protein n=1 Tax=Allosphingosinicella sp. TaxID=2823234 RepID=UPI0037851FD5